MWKVFLHIIINGLTYHQQIKSLMLSTDSIIMVGKIIIILWRDQFSRTMEIYLKIFFFNGYKELMVNIIVHFLTFLIF